MRIIIPIILFSVSFFIHAQEQVPELVTDRPDQTESSSVVPHRSLQIETGLYWGNDETETYKQKTLVYNSTLLRYGLLERMELRLGMEYISDEIEIKNTDTVINSTGLSPLYLGFKIYVTEEDGWIPEIAFLAGVGIQEAGHKDFRSPHTAPGARFSFSHTLSERFSIGYNLGAEWDGETAIPSYYYSFVFGAGLTEKIGAFVEAFGLIPEDGESSHLIDAGITYLLLPNLQLDFSGGLGLNEEAIDSFLSFGLSYRIPE